MKHLLLLSICSLPFIFLSQLTETEVREMANSSNESELVFESSRMLQDGYFYQSEILVDKLLEKQPENSNYNYRKGFIVLESRKNYIQAITYLEKAVKDVDKNYDMFGANEKSASIDAYFWLGKAYHMNEDLAKSKEYYQKFLTTNINKKSPLIPLSNLGLKQVEIAENLMKYPKNVELENMQKGINTEFPDFSPVVSLDGSALYFTSKRPWPNGESDAFRDPKLYQYTEDIYVSYKDFDGNWGEPLRLDLNHPDRNEATMAVSSDERRIYVYKDDAGFGDIYYSDFNTNRFTDVQEFTAKNVNSKAWEPHITIAPNGLSGYFVSDRSGGYGGRDIYRIVKLPDGSWSEPQNVGPSINTAYDEDSPFIAVDNKTLYFASNGPLSMGGFDIFVSVRDEDNVWSNSINLGYPLNSTVDDIFYTTTIDGLTGFMTSDRKSSQGEKDIYEIHNDYLGLKNIAVLKGYIKTSNNKDLPPNVLVTLICLNCGNPIKIKISPRLRDGAFFSSLEPCRNYEIQYSQDGKNFHTEKFSTDCKKQYDEIYKEITLNVDDMTVVKEKDTSTIVIAENKVFENISMKHYFNYNKNKLSPKEGDLNKFMIKLEQQIIDGRQNVVININSSASKVPTTSYANNQELASKRAENLKKDIEQFILENPIMKNKVIIKIVEVKVDGPEYSNDANNEAKYEPFQYAEITIAL